jgi:hypothetical protein
MIFLQYKDFSYVFGCQACKDVNRKLSVRVMTDQFYRREVRKQLAGDSRLLTAPPPQRPVRLYGQTAQQGIDWDPASRRSRDGKFELVSYKVLGNGNCQIQMAIGGKLAPQMDDHVASREEFRTEEAYWSRVARASELMLHLYGDARNPLSSEESQQREGEMY